MEKIDKIKDELEKIKCGLADMSLCKDLNRKGFQTYSKFLYKKLGEVIDLYEKNK